MNDQQIEQQILAKGLTAPRIAPADIEANIVSEHYFTADEGNFGHQYLRTINENGGVIDREARTNHAPSLKLLTFCVLVLRNGFTVTGESACASPENFDAEVGRYIARQNAFNKIWPLMGYELRSRLAPKEGYTASDVADASTSTDGITGAIRFKVTMKDGQTFVGAVPDSLEPSSVAAEKILAECNRMAIKK